jgi:hypothetical protein
MIIVKYYTKNLIEATDDTETSGSTGATLGVILGTLSPTLVIGTVVIVCALIGGFLLVKRKGIRLLKLLTICANDYCNCVT